MAGSRRPTTEAEAMEIILPAPRSGRQETSKVSPAGRRATRPAAGDKNQPPGHSTATRAPRTAEKPGDARAGLLGPLPAVFSLALGMTLFVIQSMALPWRMLFARDREDRRRRADLFSGPPGDQ
ncbi:MAG: hypothetical protein HYX74_05275 [Acidobacteria bacterium]|nr:hypothetical protein [Acidobacteriota bacterium]